MMKLALAAVLIATVACIPPAPDPTPVTEGTADCIASYDAGQERDDCVAAVKVRSMGWPTCQEEDGPGPCVWDAWSLGNGTGTSFYITAHGQVVYP